MLPQSLQFGFRGLLVALKAPFLAKLLIINYSFRIRKEIIMISTHTAGYLAVATSIGTLTTVFFYLPMLVIKIGNINDQVGHIYLLKNRTLKLNFV
jgi:hypothetical protein